MKRRCRKCKKLKHISLFGTRPSNKGGISKTCKKCVIKYQLHKMRISPFSYWVKKYRRNLVSKCRQGKILLDISFLTELKIGKMASKLVCRCCGRTLKIRVWGRGNQRGDSDLTFDRVIPSLGYTRGNVHVLCSRCNRLKNNATVGELRLLWKYTKRSLKNLNLLV